MKRLNRLELALSAAPLLVGAAFFGARLLPHSVDEARESWRYREQRPVRVVRAFQKVSGADSVVFHNAVFSPDSKQLALVEATRRAKKLGVYTVSNGKSVWPSLIDLEGSFFVRRLSWPDKRTVQVERNDSVGRLDGRLTVEQYDSGDGNLCTRFRPLNKKYHLQSSELASLTFGQRRDNAVHLRLENRMDTVRLWMQPKLLKSDIGIRLFSVNLFAQRGSKPFLLAHFNSERRELSYTQHQSQFKLSPDGRLLFAFLHLQSLDEWKSPSQRGFKIFDTRTGCVLWQRTGVNLSVLAATFSSDSRKVAIDCWDGGFEERKNFVAVYGARTGIERYRFELSGSSHIFNKTSMCFSPHNRLLATPNGDRCEIWDVSGLK